MEVPDAEARPQPLPAPVARSCVVEVDGVRARLTATGELGVGTTHVLYDAVSEVLRSDQPTWIIDVTHLDVTDHAGIRAIAGAYRRALRHERRIALHGASPALRRALIRLHLERHLLPAERVPAEDAPG